MDHQCGEPPSSGCLWCTSCRCNHSGEGGVAGWGDIKGLYALHDQYSAGSSNAYLLARNPIGPIQRLGEIVQSFLEVHSQTAVPTSVRRAATPPRGIASAQAA